MSHFRSAACAGGRLFQQHSLSMTLSDSEGRDGKILFIRTIHLNLTLKFSTYLLRQWVAC